jgi:hypothetical protein
VASVAGWRVTLVTKTETELVVIKVRSWVKSGHRTGSSGCRPAEETTIPYFGLRGRRITVGVARDAGEALACLDAWGIPRPRCLVLRECAAQGFAI